MRKKTEAKNDTKELQVTNLDELMVLESDEIVPLSDERMTELEDNATRLAYEIRDKALQKLKTATERAFDANTLGNIIAVSQGVINRPKLGAKTADVGFFENLNQQLKVKVETKTIEITYQKIPTQNEKEIKPERNSGKSTKRAGSGGKHVGGNKRKAR
ncbi:MAG: hypothetical protein A2W93_14225 [Bacteroidetes bacterium GWF2_43_63]|nr:MAG: hypothetical protein A2W94_00795 [Bacteroidetes bacterium GWE2_42_42]OFY52497.1 MAG: hypothetical protein A2W93_14225 [Bacteroidetes bacterium GWF2_43_63]HBG71404.1 hypothetical protein [Bacteroidales bacterium]HCB60844.1 hypothetical protein [Bacteroidales bacterium]HCY23431.1 hypothetical protein [Bacteroidales bacterium]